MNPSLSIIIPTYNRNEVFYKTLTHAYEAVKEFDVEIIVINDSKTNEVTIPKQYADRVSCQRNPKSGVASARNLGASLAKNDYLLFMDDDMNISKENMTKTFQFIKDHPKGCLNLNWDYPQDLYQSLKKYQFGRYMLHNQLVSLKGWMGVGEDAWKPDSLYQIKNVASYYLLMPKSTFNDVSGYDENFPFAGFEDHDFAQRLRQIETKLFLDTRTTVYHNEFDRVELDNWLARRVREGVTRKVAVEKLGYADYAINYSTLKKLVYSICSLSKGLFLLLLKAIPNKANYDKMYFSILKILVGTSMYEGYFKS